ELQAHRGRAGGQAIEHVSGVLEVAQEDALFDPVAVDLVAPERQAGLQAELVEARGDDGGGGGGGRVGGGGGGGGRGRGGGGGAGGGRGGAGGAGAGAGRLGRAARGAAEMGDAVVGEAHHLVDLAQHQHAAEGRRQGGDQHAVVAPRRDAGERPRGVAPQAV